MILLLNSTAKYLLLEFLRWFLIVCVKDSVLTFAKYHIVVLVIGSIRVIGFLFFLVLCWLSIPSCVPRWESLLLFYRKDIFVVNHRINFLESLSTAYFQCWMHTFMPAFCINPYISAITHVTSCSIILPSSRRMFY